MLLGISLSKERSVRSWDSELPVKSSRTQVYRAWKGTGGLGDRESFYSEEQYGVFRRQSKAQASLPHVKERPLPERVSLQGDP